jgi:adenosylcobinamide-GDP ribazoletransferase
MVALAFGSKSAHPGMGQIMVEQVQGWYLFIATTIALVLVVVLSGQMGLWVSLFVSIFTLSIKNYLHRRLGGVTGDTFGAVEELNETLALILIASLQY